MTGNMSVAVGDNFAKLVCCQNRAMQRTRVHQTSRASRLYCVDTNVQKLVEARS
jgi:hypothetical protein